MRFSVQAEPSRSIPRAFQQNPKQLCSRKSIIARLAKTRTKAFVGACDKFVYTEILRKDEPSGPRGRKNTSDLNQDTTLVNLLRNAVEYSAGDDGWAYLGQMGQHIANQAPEFDPRNYGYKKLGDLVRAAQLFDVDERRSADQPGI